MKFTPAPLAGVYVVEPERHVDERGFFARTWCQREFDEQGLAARLVQCSVSYNRQPGTLRGMHYQRPPFAEDKLVRVTRGRIYDVAVDLRPDSATFLDWFGLELTEENRLGLYIPRGFAHGFLSLTAGTEVYYQMSEFYSAGHGGGFRWDDPRVGVVWPAAVQVISERDRTYPDLQPADLGVFAGLNQDLSP